MSRSQHYVHFIQFDLTAIQVEVIADEDGRPALLIRSGGELQDAVELSGGAHLRDAIAGARRITEAIWNYVMAVEAMRLNGAVDPLRNSNDAGNAESP
jgi:hypothetical protein